MVGLRPNFLRAMLLENGSALVVNLGPRHYQEKGCLNTLSPLYRLQKNLIDEHCAHGRTRTYDLVIISDAL